MRPHLFLLFLFLTGCSLFSPIKTEPNHQYVLSQVPQPFIKKSSRHTTLLVNYPQSSPILNTSQMVYSTHKFDVAYFSKNQWGATPSQMLQPLIVQTLQDTHHFREIVSPGMMGQFDIILNTQLLQLQQIFFDRGSDVWIVLKAQLIDVNHNNRVLATKTFSVIEEAYPTPYGGVVAANRGMAKILRELAQFATQYAQ